jgi:hypothetical protein
MSRGVSAISRITFFVDGMKKESVIIGGDDPKPLRRILGVEVPELVSPGRSDSMRAVNVFGLAEELQCCHVATYPLEFAPKCKGSEEKKGV